MIAQGDKQGLYMKFSSAQMGKTALRGRRRDETR